MLRTLDTGIAIAEENMRLDEKLLNDLDPNGDPILHLYRWAGPSATFGYFIAPGKHIDLDAAKRYRLSLARRPTGGGIVFHIWDLAFSFLMPSGHPAFSLNTLENYRFVNHVVLETVKTFFSLREPVELIDPSAPASPAIFINSSLGSGERGKIRSSRLPKAIVEDAIAEAEGRYDEAAAGRSPDEFMKVAASPACQNFCMAQPTQYDVVYRGMKIAGAAQRKRKQGYLHQGTISLSLPHIDLLNDVLLSKKEVVQAMLKTTFSPLGRAWEPKALNESRTAIEKLLAKEFMEKL